MPLKTNCDECGRVVTGLFSSLKNVNGRYLCPSCVKGETGNKSITGLKCPVCQSEHVICCGKKFTTAGIITLLAGILLAPFCIGIFLIIAAMSMRNVSYRCSNCQKSF
jgi:hypothetical protein